MSPVESGIRAMSDASPVECDVLLRDGTIAHVRSLTPGDLAALHDLVDRSSERSAYLRFFTGGRATAHTYMDRVTAPGHQGRALVAVVRGRVAGIAEYTPYGDGTADMAVLIGDEAQGEGLGTLLLEHLAALAAAEGVGTLIAQVLSANTAMLRVLRDLGLEVEVGYNGATADVLVDLTPGVRLMERLAARDHEAERASLAPLMTPGSVAVIGAGRDPAGIGHKVVRNLIDSGFRGAIHPVNPRATTIAGLEAWPDMAAIPVPVDVAVVAVPAAAVVKVARECAATGVKGLVVLSAGFAESAGRDAERELLAVCRTAGMRLIGPNCLGIVNTAARLNASFLPHTPVPGDVAVLSQSGAVGAALLDRLAVSSFVSVGNKADVSGNDLLEYWEDDDATKVIALYLESFGNPRKFARIASRVGRRKPILLVKSGRSDAGDRAVRSHTAAAATPDIAVDALVRAAGVIRLDNVRDLIDTARLMAAQPLPAGRRVAIVGNSGGPEAMTADECERNGLLVPELPTSTALAARIPSAALHNPVDLTAGATAEDIALAVTEALAAPQTDTVLVVYTPPFGSGADATKQAIAEAARGATKPVVACVMGEDGLIDGLVPTYAYPEQAVRALARAAAYAEWRHLPPEIPGPTLDDPKAREIVKGTDGWLSPELTERLLRHFDIPVLPSLTVHDAEAAAEAAESLGVPVALKVTGPVHKSEAGGVRLNLRGAAEVQQAYQEMSASIGTAMTGAIVQPMAAQGVEIIVGGVNYPTFGPLVMVGMGGVTADLLADRSFRMPPFRVDTAAEMIADLRCSPVLYGYRGRPKTDTTALATLVTHVGHLMDTLPEVAELDLNPVIVTPEGAVAVDSRIRVTPRRPTPSPYIRRLR
ncbi:bifunctional GNAT family N-acetyltransferase/acetate--CoA ligase family protein [Sphaerisporangium rubeum]|uniref:Acyl-CoA synthetase (NDP forming)/RimJ/RimL family protein N-acetyltransferase n=1 Tax=Sphaerisporangium rubeum TaxID=321317 RepID=A0A7X0M3N5_9ACTN|nr:GNAT family N-acetyltransferase [Sphaerisporangium rubeum]MBB6470808.1 acyl-CoA synthetase (NDP forming)/RimJ/RimL family protein N-acetyltransferase [Sphaerisporangium rubeum]